MEDARTQLWKHASGKSLNENYENLSKEAALKAFKGNASHSNSKLAQQVGKKNKKGIALGEIEVHVD